MWLFSIKWWRIILHSVLLKCFGLSISGVEHSFMCWILCIARGYRCKWLLCFLSFFWIFFINRKLPFNTYFRFILILIFQLNFIMSGMRNVARLVLIYILFIIFYTKMVVMFKFLLKNIFEFFNLEWKLRTIFVWVVVLIWKLFPIMYIFR